MPSLTHLLPPTAQNPPSTPTKSHRLLTPTTNPIPLRSTPLAYRYSVFHTALIPLYYYIRASKLISDPYGTLLTDLFAVATLQGVFCAVCLPQAGSWLSGTSGGAIVDGTSSAGKGKGSASKVSGSGRKNVVGSASSKTTDGSWRGRVMVRTTLYTVPIL